MIYSLVSVVLAMLGILAILSRKTLLGMIFGMQLISQSLISFSVFIGYARGQPLNGQMVAFFMLIISLSSIVASLSLAIRIFYLRKSIELSHLKGLRH